MKLAEALQERADLNRKLAQLRSRLAANATVQEGEKPGEDPAELLAELNGCISRLEELMARINLTNSQTVVDGKTLTEWIARRDALQIKAEAYRELRDNASGLARRAQRTEIKILSTVEVREIQKQADAISQELRKIDNRIQETNWQTEL